MGNDAKKQYFLFALVIAALISYPIVYLLLPAATSPIFSGSVINITDDGGFIGFIEGIINFLLMTGVLSVTIYYIIIWYVNRG